MGYPHSLTGNDERRSDGLAAERVAGPRGVRGVEPAAVVALVLVVTIGLLVAKPWSAAPPHGDPVAAPPAIATSSPAPSPVDTARPSAAAGDPGAREDGAAEGSPGTADESVAPVDPDAWSRISKVLRTVNHDGLVFVARWPGGLYWGFVQVDASTSKAMRLVTAPTGSPGTPDGLPNGARMTGYLGAPVAIGITRASGTPVANTLAWLVRGPGAEDRVPLRHPVGDIDRYLWLGPGFGLPRGEQRNRREISRWPPTWPPGVYRFELSTAAGIRYVYVVLEPDAAP
jgi:hypothetical protein